MLDTPWQPPNPSVLFADKARTLGDLFLQRVEHDGARVAFWEQQGGKWQATTWREMYERSAATAAYLIDRGVSPGDKICIVGGTSAAWCCADLAGHLAGAVTLGAYPTLAASQLAYILEHSDSVFAFVEGAAEVQKILETRDSLPRLREVCVWKQDGLAELIAEHDWLVTLDDVSAQAAAPERIRERVAAVDPDSTAIIVYTSGTTGPPKGAMLSHHNILTGLRSLGELTRLDRDDSTFSALPMAHVAERVVNFYVRINSGMATYFASSIASVLEEIQHAQPTVFGGVPRMFEKAYGRIRHMVAQAPPSRQRVFAWAERVGREVVERWQRGEPVPLGLRLKYRLADRLVFSKMRQVFGGRVRYFVIGAAPIAGDILKFFWAAGFPIYEAYGMTEATAVTHVNRLGEARIGSVGKPLPWVESRLADDGEILVRGPGVFQGYYKDAEATAAAIDAEGWLHTGDIGKLDEDGYLHIVDRKKHIIITAGGKNLTPANIENEIKAADALISQVHVHGDRRPYLTALVTIGPVEAVAYARGHGLVSDADAQRLTAALTENPFARPPGLGEIISQVTSRADIQERVSSAVRRANERLSRVEGVKKIHLLDRELSLDEDEITPTLKVKRKTIEARFAEVFDQLYDDASSGLSTSP